MATTQSPDTGHGTLSIGQFSSFTRLSVRMLRYYDEHGILVPARVDPYTGYRYYSAAQVHQAALVRQLRDVGFSVAAIAAVLPASQDPEALRRALAVQRDHLTAEAAALRRRLAELDRLVASLMEETMSLSNTTQTTVPAHPVVALRRTMPTYSDEGQLWGEFMSLLPPDVAAQLTDRCGATYYDDGYKESDVDIELWMSLAEPVVVPAPLTCREIPEQRVLTVTLTGSYEQMAAAYEHLGEQLEAEQLTMSGPMFALYRVGPEQTQNPDEYVTDIGVPV